jgi:mono/diheme cytochrome c family protein
LRRISGPAFAGLFFLLAGTLALAQGDAKRGEYLAKAGGCVGCHTDARKDAEPYAGGRALKTPFGTFYGPNITPDLQAGIGRWTYSDFVRAIREGRRPDGENYYPAFPYPSFTRVSDGDLRDLWAYLRALKPSARPSRPHELGILYRWRVSLYPWKWLFFAPGPFRPEPGKSATVNRGAYLVQALGHCGECHTPRNLLGAPKNDRFLAGAKLGETTKAPNLTPAKLKKYGDGELKDILTTGLYPDGDVMGETMGEVVTNTTSQLTAQDLLALIAYLRTLLPLPDEPK